MLCNVMKGAELACRGLDFVLEGVGITKQDLQVVQRFDRQRCRSAYEGNQVEGGLYQKGNTIHVKGALCDSIWLD